MSFVEPYRTIEPCLVAIVEKFPQHPTVFPRIVGTGFFVSEHGVVCTCNHVVSACLALPSAEEFTGIPADVLLFREVMIGGRHVWAWFVLEILATGEATFEGGRPGFMAHDEKPDTAFVLVNASGTPSVHFSTDRCLQGEAVAFAGFPMGTALLRAPVGFRQLSPSLHTGVVSAIFPDRVTATPYGFLLHANTQGGASGSPVFRADGAVCGMVYMVLRDAYAYGGAEGEDGRIVYEVPTSLTGCISGRLISQSAAKAGEQASNWKSRPALAEVFTRATPVDMATGQLLTGQHSVV